MFLEIIKKLEQYQYIFIYRHTNPDGDALGSQYALAEFIRLNFPTKKVYQIRAINEESYLNDLFPIDKVQVMGPNLTKSLNAKSLVIILDTANQPRIAGQSWEMGTEIIRIDHHPKIEEFGHLSWVDPSYSSTCEMLADLFYKTRTKYKINPEIARYLYVGILTDTSRFYFDSVTSRTYSLTSFLTQQKINTQAIYNILYKTTIGQIRFNGYILSNFKIKNNNIAYIVVPKNIIKKFNVDASYAASQVNLLLQATDIDYAIYLSWDKNNQLWRGSLRSKKAPINKVAEQFNGGGHQKAAGIKLEDKKTLKLLLKTISKLA